MTPFLRFLLSSLLALVGLSAQAATWSVALLATVPVFDGQRSRGPERHAVGGRQRRGIRLQDAHEERQGRVGPADEGPAKPD